MSDIISILKKLCAIKSPSGFEGNAAKIIAELLDALAVPYTTDSLGNLIAHRAGGGKRVLLDAHMDTTGFLATYIDKNGFVRFDMLGGLETADLQNIPVEFLGGAQGVISCEPEEEPKTRKIGEFFIDIGAADEAEARAHVLPGDAAVFSGKLRALTKKRVCAPYLDNRIGCAVLLSVLASLKECDYDLHFVFSVQEEVGCRGAKTAAYAVNPDFALVVDVTDAGDTPGFKPVCEITCGGGAAVKIMDKAAIAHPTVVSALCDTAEKSGIPYQRDVVTTGGTDAGNIHLSRGGVPTGGVSVPVRYMHTPCEIAAVSDIDACVSLIVAALEAHAFI